MAIPKWSFRGSTRPPIQVRKYRARVELCLARETLGDGELHCAQMTMTRSYRMRNAAGGVVSIMANSELCTTFWKAVVSE